MSKSVQALRSPLCGQTVEFRGKISGYWETGVIVDVDTVQFTLNILVVDARCGGEIVVRTFEEYGEWWRYVDEETRILSTSSVHVGDRLLCRVWRYPLRVASINSDEVVLVCQQTDHEFEVKLSNAHWESIQRAVGSFYVIDTSCMCPYCGVEAGVNQTTTETEWVAEEELPQPASLEQAVKERNAWAGSAMQFSKNADYYKQQRDAFLRVALTDPAVAQYAEDIAGSGWERLLEDG